MIVVLCSKVFSHVLDLHVLYFQQMYNRFRHLNLHVFMWCGEFDQTMHMSAAKDEFKSEALPAISGL